MVWAVLAAGIVAVFVVVVLWRRTPGRSPERPPGRPATTGTASGFRLPFATPGIAVAEMHQRLEALGKVNAQWEAIWEQVNPDDDPTIRDLLGTFRGDYQFVPHAAINVLRIGCERALAKSPSADRAAAIREAMVSDNSIDNSR